MFAPPEAETLRTAVARRLVDALLEGYTDDEKQVEIDRLMARIDEERSAP